MPIIELKNLSKSFEYYEKQAGVKGSIKNLFFRKKLYKDAVKEISFSAEEGEIIGFIGPNGAGKTTTLKMLSGILFPTSGAAKVMGYTPWERKKDFKMNISIVMGNKGQLWPDLPAIECLNMTKCIYELDNHQYKKTLDELVDLMCVKDLLNIQVRRLSLGERMKIELINSLIHRPKVVFLDEPTLGLDLITQQNIHEFFRNFNRETKATILLTSHYTQDIEALCERTIIINHGDIIYDGALNKINDMLHPKKIFNLAFQSIVKKSDIESYGEIKEFDGFSAIIEVDKNRSQDFIKSVLENMPVQDFKVEDYPLERGITFLYNKNK